MQHYLTTAVYYSLRWSQIVKITLFILCKGRRVKKKKAIQKYKSVDIGRLVREVTDKAHS